MTTQVVVVAVVALLVIVGAVVMLFLRPGYVRPARRAELSPLSSPPTYPRALRDPATGTYRGTVYVEDGSPVRAYGLGGRGRVRLILAAEGLVLERHGTNDLLVDEAELDGGDVEHGLLVVHWHHGGTVLDTRVQLDDAAAASDWARALSRMGRTGRRT